MTNTCDMRFMYKWRTDKHASTSCIVGVDISRGLLIQGLTVDGPLQLTFPRDSNAAASQHKSQKGQHQELFHASGHPVVQTDGRYTRIALALTCLLQH